jgi:hypothetical protein
MLSRRSVENEVGRWHIAAVADRLKRSACLLVEVQVCVTNLADCSFVRFREPADVVRIVDSFARWLSASPIPKLFIDGDPGALLIGLRRDFVILAE